jgi:UDP-arabinose 4-epimerase
VSVERILVTGGAGFIGSHTCKALHAAGYQPVAVDNLSRGNEKAVRWGPLEKADIRDKEALVDVIRRHRPKAVIHFAAFAYVGESVTAPDVYYSNNVAGTMSLLDACLAEDLRTIVFSSSCATYGVPERLPIREDTPQRPINPYGRTKLFCEAMIRDYAEAYGFRYALLRYFNACGADPDGDLAEWHEPETHLIPRALMAAAGSIDRLEVFGDDYDTPDGTCIRDYIHVTDLAHGHVAAVRRLLAGGDSLAVNLGTGQGTSIKEMVEAIQSTFGRKVPIAYSPRRSGDPQELVAGISRAEALLDFRPRHSDIATVVRTAGVNFGLKAGADAR